MKAIVLKKSKVSCSSAITVCREQTLKLVISIVLLLAVSPLIGQVYIDYQIRSGTFEANTSSELGDEHVVWKMQSYVGSSADMSSASAWQCFNDEGSYVFGGTWNRASEILWTGACLDNADNIYIGIRTWEHDYNPMCDFDFGDDDYEDDSYDTDEDISSNSRAQWVAFENTEGGSTVNTDVAGDGYAAVYFDIYWDYSLPVSPTFTTTNIGANTFRINKTSDNSYRITSWDYQVSVVSDFSTIETSGTGITDSYVDVAGLSATTTYYIRIR